MFATQRQAVAKRWKKKEDEVERVPLWHGTDENTIRKIVEVKFDRGFASTANGKQSIA